jgi:hypothetical protein
MLADAAETGDELHRLKGVFAKEKKEEGRGGPRPLIGELDVGRGLGFSRDRTAGKSAVLGRSSCAGGRG